MGEAITERSGRINLGLEGILVFGAMTAYAVAVMTDSPWLGVLAASATGACFGLFHGWICKFPKVNDIAIGIALMLFGSGLAFFFGKPFIQPSAPDLPAIAFGGWSRSPQVQAALNINVLFLIGAALAVFLWWAFKNTRAGLIVRVVGDSSDAARAMGLNPNTVRLLATGVGGALAAIGGAYLSLYYPGSWSEGISSGQGLMAVALVIFARWNPLGCFAAALAVRRGWCVGAGIAVGRRNARLLSVLCRPLHPDASHHDSHVLARPLAGRRARRTVDHQVMSPETEQ